MSTNTENTINTKQKKMHEPLAIKLNLTKENLDTKYFFKRIKPIEGVVKYDLSTWTYFPSTQDTAKLLAKTVTKDFSQNKKYDWYVVNVFFHLDKKFLRFEIKKYQTLETFNIKIDDVSTTEQLETYLDENMGSNLGIYVYELSNYAFPEISVCKELGKNISSKLESKFTDKKYVVFFNPASNSLKITIQNRIVKPVKKNDIQE